MSWTSASELKAAAHANGAEESQAMEVLLQAEEEAERQVALAGADAEALLATARTQARDIARRADQRVRALHSAANRMVANTVLHATREAKEKEREAQQRLGRATELGSAVSRVVNWLLGVEDNT